MSEGAADRAKVRARRRRRRRWQKLRRTALSGRLLAVGAAVTVAVVLVAAVLLRESQPGNAGSRYVPPPVEQERTSVADALPAEGETLSVLVAGDSLSQGRFALKARNGYVRRVERALDEHWDATATVVGDSGRQSFDVTPDVPRRAFDLVILELGTNDATGNYAAFSENYSDLVRAVRKQSPDAGLVCLGSWQTEYRASLVDATIDRTCTEADGVYVDLNELYLDENLRGPEGAQGVYGVSDNFHPNDAGHGAMAELALEPILGQ
ncbi:SGNH/GDSL hydrolase family protein [Nocardioides marmotae]|uniref:SGNH/GDSL hydrolase family protein n=1 Tax=Nocardioides marmotae TaxID=2663857 RepID=UPI00165904B9|nr:SGNH/GDSL hydrolase family protein [Nocardioides marmotae]MBC9735328.1 SGNH/GDSL hydrolase family protein [Nocardioides marmotae]